MHDPMPTQVEDAVFLQAAGNAALWSEPGTGKTLSTILALKDVKRGLVVAPAVAQGMWRRELDSHGLQRIDLMSWGVVAKRAADVPVLDGLVLDEAHYAVRMDAQRASAIYAASGLVKRSGVVWPLTGTPMIRFPDDLWPVCSGLWPAHLDFLQIRNRTQFERRYCATDAFGQIVGARNSSLKLLHQVLDGKHAPPKVVMRRTLKEVAPFLPPVTFRRYERPMSNAEASRLNKALPPNWVQRLEQAEAQLNDDPAMVTARRLMSLLKVPDALDLIRQAPAKLIVIFVHTDTGRALLEGMTEQSIYIDGSTPGKNRQRLVDQFNSPTGPRVMIGQLHTMGVAINPHENCSHMLFVERDWSAAILEQAVNRVRRLGQTQHQQIDFLDCDHPMDARMARTASKKLRSMGILMGADA